uniref:Uncharacterized protein n=1 Tax=Chrysemys picta bellii TaxID=8478 RepID=A0A8C3IJN2_CHRPI
MACLSSASYGTPYSLQNINIGRHSIWYYGSCMKVMGGPWTYRAASAV